MAGGCPLYDAALVARRTAPCEQCGADSDSLERFRGGDQSYHLVRVLGGRELVLCLGCMVGFGTIDPVFLGVDGSADYGFEHMQVVREINNPTARSDHFCPECGYRLKFLSFVKDVRSHTTG